MIETVSEFKKNVKALVKGAIKSKVFGSENTYKFKVVVGTYDKKERQGMISVATANGPIAICLSDNVGTRVYNRVNDEFFAPIVEQFEKLKSVEKIEFEISAEA